MIEIGNYCYSFYCEVQGNVDSNGIKYKPFNELTDSEKLVWFKTASYTIMQFSLLFNKSLTDNIEKLENDDEDEKEEIIH